MLHMRTIAVVLGIAGFVFGLLAAYYWQRASKVMVAPVWGDREPLDTDLSTQG